MLCVFASWRRTGHRACKARSRYGCQGNDVGQQGYTNPPGRPYGPTKTIENSATCTSSPANRNSPCVEKGKLRFSRQSKDIFSDPSPQAVSPYPPTPLNLEMQMFCSPPQGAVGVIGVCQQQVGGCPFSRGACPQLLSRLCWPSNFFASLSHDFSLKFHRLPL